MRATEVLPAARPTANPAAMHRLLALLCIGLAPLAGRAGSELAASADGTEVASSSGLVWARCVEGMQWNGRTCTGLPLWLSHAEARAAAAARREQDGAAWRVPRVQELQVLFRRTARTPGIDTRLFPSAPPSWHWTSTTKLDLSSVNPYNYGNIRRGVDSRNVNRISYLHGWAVHAETGEVSPDHLKRSKLLVRLVRTAEPAAAPASAGR